MTILLAIVAGACSGPCHVTMTPTAQAPTATATATSAGHTGAELVEHARHACVRDHHAGMREKLNDGATATATTASSAIGIVAVVVTGAALAWWTFVSR